MSNLSEELLAIADKLETLSEHIDRPEVSEPLARLQEAAETVGKAWSRSWLGYQAQVYYQGLQTPPPGAHFSVEWGFQQLRTIRTTTGEWREFNREEVVKAIHDLAGNPSLEAARELAIRATSAFETQKSEVLSLLTAALRENEDTFLTDLKQETDKIAVVSVSDVILVARPSGNIMTRDSLALTQGLRTPPHYEVLAETMSLRSPANACRRLAQVARKAGSHLARMERRSRRSRQIGTNVFIGHGSSAVWRDLKDFLQDRLHLPWDEFNRVPIAGITNIARLSEMLDASVIAFLVMTGEDEQADGRLHARMNVVHEAGLFQGRLGFTRAIVLLEEGCEEFSNIQGLGQIRFPKGNIKAVFEDIRRILEREGILEITRQDNPRDI
jgi:predicted nucleotide-binding protein